MKRDVDSLKNEIAEIDREILELTNNVKIIGELDQDGDLIISEDETLPEAVKRQNKTDTLLKKKKGLTELLEKHNQNG